MPRVDTASLIIWILTIALHCWLCWAMRASVTRWTALFAYSALMGCLGITLLVLFYCDSPAGYFWCYWTGRGLQFIAQFGILWGMVRSLLGISSRWRRALLKLIVALAVASLAFSGWVTMSVRSPFYLEVTRVVTSLDRWAALGFCILFVFVAFSLDLLGLKWRREVLSVGLGFALQSVSSTCFVWIITLVPISCWRIPSLVRDLIDLVAIAIWISAFKPVRNPEQLGISRESLESALTLMETTTLKS